MGLLAPAEPGDWIVLGDRKDDDWACGDLCEAGERCADMATSPLSPRGPQSGVSAPMHWARSARGPVSVVSCKASNETLDSIGP
eukprot:CAMPEP_0206249480 /NCGR_PEP_ID=MMETSP0047_2-20121206/20931_1 /ASSEMBLY_ACC=CAM_ASM_000192 /TAXON_ID=195065 /ORGANISM="Chroomonas mesostigmatica_cf, Strain CCMP1168" /LENGTH=83 /DNA_ID=CAMNT_0053675205 /DNA_START=676 /DNA_END=927 /DNA_ORIENTATION=+